MITLNLQVAKIDEHFKLLNANQNGFRSKLNTIKSALALTENLRGGVRNRNKDTVMVLLDLQKAFECSFYYPTVQVETIWI